MSTNPGNQIVRQNVNVNSSLGSITSTTSILPVAKVLPQQQLINEIHPQQIPISSAGQNNMYIQTRSPSASVSNPQAILSNTTSFIPASNTFFYEPTSTASSNTSLTLSTPGSINSLTNTTVTPQLSK